MNFANSKFYKMIMPYLYGWGASLVIAGALFKILSSFKFYNLSFYSDKITVPIACK